MAQNVLAIYLSSHPNDWNVWKKCVCYCISIDGCAVSIMFYTALICNIYSSLCRAIDIEFNLNNIKEVSAR